jgi:hypothetical protein
MGYIPLYANILHRFSLASLQKKPILQAFSDIPNASKYLYLKRETAEIC